MVMEKPVSALESSKNNPSYQLDEVKLLLTLPDYVWLDPVSGEITCWINNLPDFWTPAGTNDGIIGSGAGPAESVFIAVCSRELVVVRQY